MPEDEIPASIQRGLDKWKDVIDSEPKPKPKAKIKHGTSTAYRNGCRCPRCRLAKKKSYMNKGTDT